MSQQDHAFIAPSSAARTVKCPGWLMLALLGGFVEESGIEAQEGEAAHFAAAELLRGNIIDVGQCAPNGVTLVDEMILGAEMYADHIKARGPVGNVETTLRNDALHPTENWGTPDHVAFVVNNTRLRIFIDDFKFGHDYVEVYMNWQLLNYLALVLHSIRDTWYDDRLIDVTLTIAQPRNYHRNGPIRSWSFVASDARAWFNIMRGQFESATRQDAKCIPNPECTHCPGRHACEALTADTDSSCVASYSSVPLNLTPVAVGRELRRLRHAAKRMEARITGLEEQALSLIARQGINVPYFNVEHGTGRTAWTVPTVEVITLGQSFGVDVSKPDVITPTQAITKGKHVPGWIEIVKACSFAPPGAAKLVEDDGTKAALIFASQP